MVETKLDWPFSIYMQYPYLHSRDEEEKVILLSPHEGLLYNYEVIEEWDSQVRQTK